MQGREITFGAVREICRGGLHEADWSDLLHPCAWLEVRRGLRTRLFIASFLGLHTVLCAVIIFVLTGPLQFGPDGRYLGFWYTCAVHFLLVLPSRSLGALRDDWDRGSVELLVFTRMGPHGVVTGKWLAYALEIVLLACTLTPYIILHYFGNGANPIYELSILTCLALAGCSLCAIGVTISTIPNRQRRLVALILTIVFLPFFGGQMLGGCVYLVGAIVMAICYALDVLYLIPLIAYILGLFIGLPVFYGLFILLPLRFGTQWIDERTRGLLRS